MNEEHLIECGYRMRLGASRLAVSDQKALLPRASRRKDRQAHSTVEKGAGACHNLGSLNTQERWGGTKAEIDELNRARVAKTKAKVKRSKVHSEEEERPQRVTKGDLSICRRNKNYHGRPPAEPALIPAVLLDNSSTRVTPSLFPGHRLTGTDHILMTNALRQAAASGPSQSFHLTPATLLSRLEKPKPQFEAGKFQQGTRRRHATPEPKPFRAALAPGE